MKDLMGLMKQAKEMQSKMQVAQAKIADLSVEGHSASGRITVGLAGGGNMNALKIDPALFSAEDIASDVEKVEGLIVAAYQDAKIKLDEAQARTMQETVGDIPLPPGMNLS